MSSGKLSGKWLRVWLLRVSHPTRSGCRQNSVCLRPTYLTAGSVMIASNSHYFINHKRLTPNTYLTGHREVVSTSVGCNGRSRCNHHFSYTRTCSTDFWRAPKGWETSFFQWGPADWWAQGGGNRERNGGRVKHIGVHSWPVVTTHGSDSQFRLFTTPGDQSIHVGWYILKL